MPAIRRSKPLLLAIAMGLLVAPTTSTGGSATTSTEPYPSTTKS